MVRAAGQAEPGQEAREPVGTGRAELAMGPAQVGQVGEVHHVAFGCNGMPWQQRLEAFETHGYRMIQSGMWEGKVPYAYFETEGDTTTTFEIFDIPADFVLPEPDEWYPGPPPAA